eukprot:7038865-Prorocentrum_lima.AAC.1
MTVHISALRELLEKQCIREIIWCDHRDMVADPFTKGKTLRNVLNIVLHNGGWVVEHETKKWSHKAPSTVAPVSYTHLRAHETRRHL